MNTKRILTIALTLVAITTIVVLATNRHGENQADLLAKLSSPNWAEREEAVAKLTGNPDSLKANEVRSVLVELLERENRLIEETLRESNGTEGVSVKYGEGYSEYYSRLLGVVEQTADFNDSRTLSALAHSSFNPASLLGKRLASHANAIAPSVLEITSSDIPSIRNQALGVLGEIVNNDKQQAEQMATELREQAKRALIRGTGDADIGVRIQAVRALGKLGDPDQLPLLETILKSDAAAIPAAEPDKSVFPVRQEALKAISAIKQAKGNRPR